MTPTPDRLTRLAKRLALPERPTDETFVARVQFALRARALEQQAARDRREQVLVELSGGAALLVAAHQIASAGERAVALLTPLTTGLGGLALLGLALAWMASTLAGERDVAA